MKKFYNASANEGGGGAEKDFTPEGLLKELNTIKTDLEQKAKDEVERNVADKLKAVNEAIEAIKKANDEDKTAEKLEAMAKDLHATIKALDILQTRIKSGGGRQSKEREQMTFADGIGQIIADNVNEIKGFKTGGDVRLKAAGDMSITTNFPDAAPFLNDIRPLVIAPREYVYVSDILPQSTTTKSAILYPKADGGEGKPAGWTAGVSKPLIDKDFTTATAPVRWIAGIVHIEREMLDDVDWLTSYLQTELLFDLKDAEEDVVLNGLASAPTITGLLASAPAYTGTKTIGVEKILDAAYGQLRVAKFVPNFVVMHPSDAVSMALNKATGSGEYNLPGTTTGFMGGVLQMSGLNVITTTFMPVGSALVLDSRRVAQLVKRLQPELRFFEQNKDDVEKNMITIRIEERIALPIFHNNAMVLVTL